MCILVITSGFNKAIHTIKVSRVILKRIFIITLLFKSPSIILCRFSSKCCSISCMHKPYIILNEIRIALICIVSLTIPAYSTIIVLSSSNSRSTIIRFVCKLTHYIVKRSITITISVQLLSYKRAHSVNKSINRIIFSTFIFMKYRMLFI
jgi:hypothetical protein